MILLCKEVSCDKQCEDIKRSSFMYLEEVLKCDFDSEVVVCKAECVI